MSWVFYVGNKSCIEGIIEKKIKKWFLKKEEKLISGGNFETL